MPDLLLELLSEEIPARMQRKAAGDLRKLVTDALVDAGLTYEGAKEHWTPRRLALDLRGLTPRSADIREEKKGPRTDAPEQAIAGFLRGAGLASVDQAEVRSDPKKGDFYVAVIAKPGRDAKEIIAEAIPGIIRTFPWPKSMRWGEASREPGSLKWVRPLQSIVCTFGPETEEPEVIPLEVDGITASNVTRGHRFMAPNSFEVKRFDDYVAKLEAAKVVLDAERRKEMILADARNLAFAQGYELVEDEGLAEEVANLVEWPVVLMGEFEEAFLDIPDEVIRLTIRENQKCFVLSNKDGALTNKFMLVANVEASDGGAEIARGNGKVVRARLSDARYFWETDLQVAKSDGGFDKWIAKLDDVTFHAKLGSQGERVKRIMALAKELAEPIAKSFNGRPLGAEEAPAPDGAPSRSGGEAARVSAEKLAKQAERAAYLAKADLQSQMVFEFPELQGKMGRRYAEEAGEDSSVARAIEEHYSPLGPSDAVPTDPVSVAVALADKLDTLVGFWAIDEKPTGSKDPYALRRAALGVIRLVLENKVRLGFHANWHSTWLEHFGRKYGGEIEPIFTALRDLDDSVELKNFESILENVRLSEQSRVKENVVAWTKEIVASEADLLSFFHDRLKVFLRDTGARHDLIDAVISPPVSPLAGEMSAKQTEGGKAANSEGSPPSVGPSGSDISPARGERGGTDDLLIIVEKVRALQKLIESEDGQNLFAGYKRAANILAAEEKKGTAIAETVDPALFAEAEEKALFDAIGVAETEAAGAVAKEDFEGAMSALAKLRSPVDAFFDQVLVNAEDDKIRANRLALLARIPAATATVADFSRIAG